MRIFLGLVLAGLIGLIGFSFLGARHPAADSFAVFRVWIAVAGLLCAILMVRGKMRFLGLAALLCLGLASPVAGYVYHAMMDRSGPYTLYQKNLLYDNSDPTALIAEFRALHPDFVTLQELWDDTMPIWNGIADLYPYRIQCFGEGGGNSASLLSQWAFVRGSETCRDDLGLSYAQVDLPEGPVWLVALHLPWPYPFGQAQRMAEVEPLLGALDGPVVLGGDFNMVAWSDTMRRIEAATGSRRAGPVLTTFRGAGGLLNLPIDHVLTPDGQGQVEARPYLGSDHKGLLLHFAL